MINALINTYIQFWKNGLDFKGRTRRKDFWVAFFGDLLIVILGFLIITFSFLLYDKTLYFTTNLYLITVASFFLGFFLITFIPTLAISVRRLHDIGLSGWWLLPMILANDLKSVLNVFFNIWTPILDVLHFAIIVGTIIVFSIPSQPFTNRYGENPLEKSPLESKATSSDENSQ